MADNIPARAATAIELEKFRAQGQFSKIGIVIDQPVSIYAAQINQTFATQDGIASIVYDSGSGTLADVKVGMTVKIGSTAGASDKGTCRVRKTPTSDTLYINETSDIAFADNDYITVVDEFRIWQRDMKIIGSVSQMDYDIQFGSYANGGCIPRVAPPCAVLFLENGEVTFTPPAPTLSECYDGAQVASYLYTAPGAATTSNMDTDAPSWTYQSAGRYYWSCAITDTYNRVTYSHRWIYVNPPALDFTLAQNPTGDFSSGDWSFAVTLYDNATQSDVGDGVMVTLYADDYYGGVAGGIGKLAGYENILCHGWIDGESIARDAEAGSVTFTVHSAVFWLDKIAAFPFEIMSVPTAADNWRQVQDMTIDRALAYILFWMSTVTSVTDCFLPQVLIMAKIFANPAGSLLTQLKNILASKRLGYIACNNYGQVFFENQAQIEQDITRSAYPVVMDLTPQDWSDTIEINKINPTVSMVELSGFLFGGTTESEVFSRAPGLAIGKRYGDISSSNNLALESQDECNRIAGCMLAWKNNEYENLDVALTSNNRLFDIAPNMVARLTIGADETPRGISLTNRRLYPRRIEYIFDGGVILTKINFEFETSSAGDGITYIPPSGNLTSSPNMEMPEIAAVDMPSIDLGANFPTVEPPTVETPCAENKENSFALPLDIETLDGNLAETLISRAYFPCTIRGSGDSVIIFNFLSYGDALSNISVFAVKDGARVLTATVSSVVDEQIDSTPTMRRGLLYAEFAPAQNMAVDSFEIVLAAGVGSDIGYVAKDVFATGSFDAADANGSADIAITVGTLYSVENFGGPWQGDQTPLPAMQYAYKISVTSGSIWSQVYGWYQPAGGEDYRLAHGLLPYESGGEYIIRVFRVDGTDEKIRVAAGSDTFADNSGSMSFSLRNVEITGRAITLTGGIHNVCAIETTP